MIAKQIPYSYPRIKFIVPHLGGPIPMLMNRLDKQGQGPRGHPNLAEAPSVTARRFYYDTVCYGSKPAFLCALEAFGADHIVTGSDYPVLQDWEVHRETFAYRRKSPTRSCTTTRRSCSASITKSRRMRSSDAESGPSKVARPRADQRYACPPVMDNAVTHHPAYFGRMRATLPRLIACRSAAVNSIFDKP